MADNSPLPASGKLMNCQSPFFHGLKTLARTKRGRENNNRIGHKSEEPLPVQNETRTGARPRGGSEISRNYAAWRASADFSVLLRDPRDLRVKGRAQSYSRRKHGTSRNYANSYLGI